MIMRRKSIDHILRAAAGVTGQTKFVLVGSAAVIARSRNIPLDMMATPEIDIYAADAADVESWLTEGVRTGILSLKHMAGRLRLMPAPDADGNPPSYDVLKDRLHSLAARANIDFSSLDTNGCDERRH